MCVCACACACYCATLLLVAIFKAVMNNNNSQVEQLLSTGHIDLTW